LILVVWSAASTLLHAQSPESLFERANAAYQSGDFAGAEKLYRQVLDAGINNGVVWYNAGNAYFKQKKLGSAIYCWEKAKRRLPLDPDIRANLELANLLVVDRIEVAPEPLFVRWLNRGIHLLTPEQESWAFLLLFTAGGIFAAIAIQARRPATALRALIAAGLTAALALCFAGSFGWKAYESDFLRRGVVVAEKADIRSGPGTDNITVVTIHEGMQLRVLGQTQDWLQVSLPNGWAGWLPSETVWIL
jgi:tetratricopeptide (TPR) repeat protein